MTSFVAILLISFPYLVISLSLVSDKTILLRIKQQWGNQPAMQSWNSTPSPCHWSGIECTNGKTVTGISLVYKHINGQIPNEFANLTILEKLDLSWNSITGKIPSELFFLKNLTYLYLNSNRLAGEIPNLIEALKLEEIDISTNQLNGSIPKAIWKIPSLKKLMLANNQFSGHLPADMCLASQLEFVDLSKNKISGPIPPSINNCKNLLEFHASNNLLWGKIPGELTALSSLMVLELDGNRLSELPLRIFSWKSLVTLSLANNNLSVTLPAALGSLPNLQNLDLTNNKLWGIIPVELTALSCIETLKLDDNQLSEELPARIISWKSLYYLSLANNSISGTLPAAFSLPKLTYLDLSNNQLSGSLPVNFISFRSLPSLEHLYMSHNKLSGQIPPELARVQEIDISSNCFSGQIPDAFDNSNSFNFSDNAHLCSSTKFANLPQCPSSIHINLAAIIVPGAIIFLASMYLISKTVKKGRQEEHSSEQQTWELKLFHKLDFTETMIVAGLADNNMIGSGGSGKVYRIIVNDSGDKVAVKRIFNSRKLDESLEKQFLTEIEILGTFRHANIVKLLCCVTNAQVKLLVYEYMENQSLDKWFGRKRRAEEPSSMGSPDPNTIITWPIRLRIAIGAAKGLCYLHHDCSPPIIHRDVKSSNILLDSKFNAKIADLGLARVMIMTGEPQTASVIAGSFGYIAPEYWRTKRLNEKIDVYSFGVVLLELTTGKDPCKGNDHLNLADWSWQHCCEEESIIDALDLDIKEPNFIEQMVNVFKLGLLCTSKMPSSRPSMKQVLQLLIAFSQHEASDQTQTVNEE